MDFTRQPIIETIITPKEGFKLVVRSSKSSGQEEFFVDAVEVVAFGNALFFRSTEKPKAFLVPISDYEVLEVREARMVLKSAGPDRSIKIGGGRETSLKVTKEAKEAPEEGAEATSGEAGEGRTEPRLDKKRDRRRQTRKRRGKDDIQEEAKAEGAIPPLEEDKISIPAPKEGAEEAAAAPATTLSPSVLSSLLQPPPTLISETIGRYRENANFKSAFFMTDDEQYKAHDKVEDLLSEDDEVDFKQPPLDEPTFTSEGQGHPQPAETDLLPTQEGLGLPATLDEDLNPNKE